MFTFYQSAILNKLAMVSGGHNKIMATLELQVCAEKYAACYF